MSGSGKLLGDLIINEWDDGDGILKYIGGKVWLPRRGDLGLDNDLSIGDGSSGEGVEHGPIRLGNSCKVGVNGGSGLVGHEVAGSIDVLDIGGVVDG